jgi:hypothetical protein
LTAIPANTTIPQANLVNPSVVGTISGGNVSATAISTELMTTTGNLDFRVGTSQNTAFRIESTGQLWNTYESDVGTDYRTTLHRGYMARAWVNFDGTGTVAIRASGNVSSITDNGVGNYTVNFTTAMPDVNYSAIGIKHNVITNTNAALQISPGVSDYTVNGVGVFTVENNALTDTNLCSVSIFR